jgi:KDO2-lipid IV(A) lauroyltransferase
METLLYWLAMCLVGLIQALPLRLVARIGRAGGGLGYLVDARHRKVALQNLAACFGKEKSGPEITALARENFKRIGESYACGIKTAAMTFDQLKPHLEFTRLDVIPPVTETPPRGIVAAIGHFGNFELYARFAQLAPGYKCATTYRALRPDSLNRLLLSLRNQSGAALFERRTQAAELKAFMNQPAVMLGLLADQSGSANGIRMPFLGRECWTSPAPAVFALRYHCGLHVGICYRVGLAKWRIEASNEIPTHQNGIARPIEAIMRDINHEFEKAVLRDPANWFWVHNRWKERKTSPKKPRQIAIAMSETIAP